MRRILLLALLLLPLVASADEFDYDFEVDVICYRILEGNEVEVAREPWKRYLYTGDMVIPETVVYDGTEYTVTAIGKLAFQGSSITSISLPSTLKVIADMAFHSCVYLKEISLPEGLEEIGAYAFEGSGLCSVTIPSTVSRIGSIPFNQCGFLVKIENGHLWAQGLHYVEVAEGNPYYDSREGCNAIIETATNKLIQGTNNTVVPDGVEVIADSAFYCCKRITELRLPASIKEFGVRCFWNCQDLRTIYNFNPEPIEVRWPLFLLRSEWALDATLYVPKGSKEAYESVLPWGEFEEIVEFDPMNIGLQTVEAMDGETYFSADGKQLQSPQRGMNIVRHADGTTTKVVIK